MNINEIPYAAWILSRDADGEYTFKIHSNSKYIIGPFYLLGEGKGLSADAAFVNAKADFSRREVEHKLSTDPYRTCFID